MNLPVFLLPGYWHFLLLRQAAALLGGPTLSAPQAAMFEARHSVQMVDRIVAADDLAEGTVLHAGLFAVRAFRCRMWRRIALRQRRAIRWRVRRCGRQCGQAMRYCPFMSARPARPGSRAAAARPSCGHVACGRQQHAGWADTGR